MQKLIDAIHKAHQLLLQVNAGALTPQLLSLTEKGLQEIDISNILKELTQSLPQKSDEKSNDENDIKQLNTIADRINTELASLNSSLAQIKQLRETLNLPALDGIITSAQKIVRPIYAFTSNLNSQK